jgi:hypothetical protein
MFLKIKISSKRYILNQLKTKKCDDNTKRTFRKLLPAILSSMTETLESVYNIQDECFEGGDDIH